MKITSVVMMARRATRWRAATKARSVASPKRGRGAILLGEGLHGAHRVERLAAFRHHVGHARLRLARQRPHLAAEQDDRHDGERHHGQRQQRELGIGDDQHDDAADAHQRVAQRHRGRGADHLLDELGVGRDPAHDVARALDLEPGRPQPHDMGEQVAAQVADDPLAQPRHEVEARARGDRQHDGDGQQRGQRVVQDVGPALGEAAVDQGPQAGAEGQHRAGRDQERQQRQRHPAAIGPEIGPRAGRGRPNRFMAPATPGRRPVRPTGRPAGRRRPACPATGPMPLSKA